MSKGGETMGKALWGWMCWFLFLFIIDFTIPFHHTLQDVQKVTGSFLFWIVWMAVAIVSMFVIFLRWKDGGKKA
jgi:hypothetical protein